MKAFLLATFKKLSVGKKILLWVTISHLALALFLLFPLSHPVATIAPIPTKIHTIKILSPSPKPKPRAVRKPKAKPSQKKTDPLTAVRKSLNAISRSRSKQKATAPNLPSTISLETPPSDAEDYTQAVIDHLQKMLTLPEYGEVRVALTIASDGSVHNLQVLAAQNPRNQAYIEKELPRLHFPTPDAQETTQLELALRHGL